MRIRSKACAAVVVAWAAVGSTSIGRADDSPSAQALFDQGKKASAAHDYAEACPKFEESWRLEPALGALLNLADCYEHQRKLATAWSKFLELAARARMAGQTERAEIGRKRAAALASRLSNLVIAVPDAEKTPGLELKRDGRVVGQAEWGTPIPADPGEHTVEAAAPDRQRWSTTVNVSEGAKTSTVSVPELSLIAVEAKPRALSTQRVATAEPSAPSSDTMQPRGGFGAQKILALLSGGIGLAGVGVGTYFGLQSMAKHDDALKECPTTPCKTGPGVQLWSDATNAGDRSTVAFVVGAAGLAGAMVLWFTAPKHASGAALSAQVGVGPGSLQLRGAW